MKMIPSRIDHVRTLFKWLQMVLSHVYVLSYVCLIAFWCIQSISWNFKMLTWGDGFRLKIRSLGSGWWKWCWWHHDVDDLKLVTICGCWCRNFDICEIFRILVPFRIVGDKKLVTIFGCWCQNFDLGDIFWILLSGAYITR